MHSIHIHKAIAMLDDSMHVNKIQCVYTTDVYCIEFSNRVECKVKTSDCEKRSYESVCLVLNAFFLYKHTYTKDDKQ